MFKSLLNNWLKLTPSTHTLETDFLAAMSHEVRTPLNGVVGTVGLLSQMQLTERQHTYVETIRKSSDQLLQVMNNVLDLVKMDAGQFTLEPMSFDIAAATNLAVEAFTHECQARNVELIVRHQPNLTTRVIGDPERYRQIISGVLSNAVKYTREGYIYLNLKHAEKPSAAGLLSYQIEIEDTGVGIPPAKLEEIHRQFARPQLSSYHRHEGTGLGLILVHGLLRLFGGQMAISSSEKMGTTFTLELSFPPAAAETRPPPFSQNSTLQNTRALLVNTSPLSRRVTHEMLRACGIQVEEAGNSKDALTKIKSGRSFDLLLMDTVLSDAETFIKQVKSLTQATLVALAHTGQHGDDRRYEQTGFSAYLLKPYTLEEFSSVLSLAHSKSPTLSQRIVSREHLHRLRLYGKTMAENSKTDFGSVLVIEDDAVNQQMLEIVLNRLGAKPTLAPNGKEGLEMFASSTFNLVLMDMNMPFMDGPETARQMRAMERRRNRKASPIIALTASSMKDDRAACLGAGMNDFLTKPVTLEKLQAVMEKWAQR